MRQQLADLSGVTPKQKMPSTKDRHDSARSWPKTGLPGVKDVGTRSFFCEIRPFFSLSFSGVICECFSWHQCTSDKEIRGRNRTLIKSNADFE